jgi:GDP-4-dehydro-6-deoxy-D-mannose reductase
MTKVLVTGATGFIGTRLLPRLRAVGHEIIAANSKSGDIRAESTWAKFPPAEVVIHLAGKSFVPDSWTDSVGFISCNVLGTVSALEYCKANEARLVFLSSYLYGNPETLPIPETAGLVATNPYALSKKLAEEVCQFYGDKFGVNVTILRPFNVYGPGQRECFLLPSVIRQVNAGDVIRVKDLEPRRDYLYIGDLVDVIATAVDLRHSSCTLNVGSGVSHSVAEVIQVIQGLKQTRLRVESSEERRRDEVMDTVADITKAKRVLGWEPKWSLSQGIEAILQEEQNDGRKDS